jgi:two-component system, NarL family, nitrate/nitrite response regulator NarL
MRVLLLDDHSMFRESVADLLRVRYAMEVLPAGTVSEAIGLLSTGDVTIAVVDYDLGQQTALDFIKEAVAAQSTVPVLILTAGVTAQQAMALVRPPISGLMLKNRPASELADTVSRVAHGESYWDPNLVGKIMAGYDVSTALTTRERSVLIRISDGESNKEIAKYVDMTESQVKGVVQRLFFKTGAKTRAQLVRVALDNPDLLK